jgi:hypothetical protein
MAVDPRGAEPVGEWPSAAGCVYAEWGTGGSVSGYFLFCGCSCRADRERMMKLFVPHEDERGSVLLGSQSYRYGDGGYAVYKVGSCGMGVSKRSSNQCIAFFHIC